MVKASGIRIAYLKFFWTFHKPGFNSRDFRKNPTSGIILRLYFSSSRKSTFLLNTFAFVERWAYCHNDSLSYPKFTVVVFCMILSKNSEAFLPTKTMKYDSIPSIYHTFVTKKWSSFANYCKAFFTRKRYK